MNIKICDNCGSRIEPETVVIQITLGTFQQHAELCPDCFSSILSADALAHVSKELDWIRKYGTEQASSSVFES